VLFDLMMPVMDGVATTAALHRIDPLVRILATSGASAGNRFGRSAGVRQFLAKPYTGDQLLRALHDLLQLG
jgi:CheY-like chemotaxis protein